jgi:hypothetical protein
VTVVVLLSDWRVLKRRWYVVCVGLVITLALGWAVSLAVPAKYEATANVLMLPPRTADGTVKNPYLDLGGMEGIADVLVKSMSDLSTGIAIQQAGAQGTFSMLRDTASAAPVLLVTVDGPSSDETVAVEKTILDLIPKKLESIQKASGAEPKTFVTSTVITQDTAPTKITKSQLRAVLIVLAIGLAGSYIAAALLDGLLLSRRRRKTGPTSSVTNGSAPDPAVAPASTRASISAALLADHTGAPESSSPLP